MCQTQPVCRSLLLFLIKPWKITPHLTVTMQKPMVREVKYFGPRSSRQLMAGLNYEPSFCSSRNSQTLITSDGLVPDGLCTTQSAKATVPFHHGA